MRQLAVVSYEYYESLKEINANLTALAKIDNIKIPLAIVNNKLYSESAKNKRDWVLVKKIGFSLNYRDISIIRNAWALLEQRTKGKNFIPIGSDFAARIVDKSDTVHGMEIGSLVIPNCTYNKSSKGIPTNSSSKEFQYFEKKELSILNSNISDEHACTLGVGMITAHSMIRKAEITKNDKILITSITSSTSQFVLNLLKLKYSNDIYAISFSNKINKLNGITKIFSNEEISKDLPVEFDVVFDPFSDTYMENLLNKLNVGARYVTCGLYSRTKNYTKIDLQKFLYLIISKNISVIGNCLGDEEDMRGVLELIEDKIVDITIDSTYKYSNGNLQDFIDSSLSIKPRIGKVAYLYDK